MKGRRRFLSTARITASLIRNVFHAPMMKALAVCSARLHSPSTNFAAQPAHLKSFAVAHSREVIVGVIRSDASMKGAEKRIAEGNNYIKSLFQSIKKISAKKQRHNGDLR